MSRNLLASDYKNIALGCLSVLLTCTMAGVVYAIEQKMKYGITIGILLLVLDLIIFPLQSYIHTSSPIGITGFISLSLGVLLNYGYGYLYYHFSLNENSNSSENGINVLFNTFVIPVIICYFYAILK